MNVEQAADAQEHVRWALAQRDQNEILADLHLVRSIHEQIVGKREGMGQRSPVDMVARCRLPIKAKYRPSCPLQNPALSSSIRIRG